jgi:alpha-N-arabinofuranosidase
MKIPPGTLPLAVWLGLLLLVGLPVYPAPAGVWQMTVAADRPGPKINPWFYGAMTEEINHAYDGGLYAELIQNRIFKDDPNQPVHWSLVQDGGGTGALALDKTDPLNPELSVSLKLDVTMPGARVGAANDGFWGIPVRPNTTYHVTFYARGSGATGPLTVSLENKDGRTKYAQATTPDEPRDAWRKFELELRTGADITPSLANRFVVSVDQPGTVWLSFVSLFPPTYKNRANGNRIDLMEKLAALHPAFLRLPGGNYLDPGHYPWKITLGPVDQRPGHPGAWHYRSSDGLGMLEFLEWCEDLQMEPLLAVSDGRGWLPAAGDIGPLVQDALDEIEYVTGGPETKWGAKRVADGHPAPFPLRYVEIGNEDFFDQKTTYDARFTKFFDAIRARYPKLLLISTRQDLTSRVPDLIDDHLYATPAQMYAASFNYDHYDRTKPKVFVGEWATNGDGKPTPTLRAALSDAAYLTGLERNADVIEMACYAPLLVNVNPGARQWPTNLIGFDALNSYGSPSYDMQVMFSHNRGDVVLPVEISAAQGVAVSTGPPRPIFASVTHELSTGDIILKVVNSAAEPQQVHFDLHGAGEIAPTAFGQVLTGQPEDVNSIGEPEKVSPRPITIADAGKSFEYSFAPYSVTVFRLKQR